MTEKLIEDYKDRFKDIDRVILNDEATIVILNNGIKGVVKLEEGDAEDVRVGILEGYIKALKQKPRNSFSFPDFFIPYSSSYALR